MRGIICDSEESVQSTQIFLRMLSVTRLCCTPSHLQMKQKACIIICVFREPVPHFSNTLRDLADQTSISKAQGAEGLLPIWGWNSKLPFGRSIPAVNQLPHSDLQVTVYFLPQNTIFDVGRRFEVSVIKM